MQDNQRDYVPNYTLRDLRDEAGLTQQELASQVNELAEAKANGVHVDALTISRWERGVIQRPSAIHRRLLAQVFRVAIAELGFLRPKQPSHLTSSPVQFAGFALESSAEPLEPQVQADQDRWRVTRRGLNCHRGALAAAASRLYEPSQRIGATGLLAARSWLPETPVSLEDIELTHRVDDPTPTITGMEDSSRAVRPLASADSRFTRYSLALRDLENPRILENRLSYRLHDVEWSNDSGRLAFGNMTYFEGIDIGEALAHEMAETHLCVGRSETVVARPSWRSLRLRKAVGDPFDFSRRSQLTSINTLTIRRSPTGASIVLHDRNAGNVAVGGGTIHVMPAGTFQPSSVLPEAHAMDFDLWHNMMREYSEEFLGHAEHGGDGAPADYSLPPFDLMCQARRDGRIRVWCLGVGLDALTLFGEVLTVVVFDADVYDELFADLVRTNDEGSVIQVGDRAAPSSAVPFDGFSLPRILEQPTLAPAAAGCLSLAWAHRDRLLA